MKMNYDYCRLDENAILRYAPSIIKDDAGYHANPPQEVYAANGWYRKTATPPEAVEGRYWVENEPKDWAWDAETMTVAVTYHEEVVPEPEPMPKRYNKYRLVCAVKEAHLLTELTKFMETHAEVKMLWDAAQEFASDDPNFQMLVEQFDDEFGAYNVDQILAEAEV